MDYLPLENQKFYSECQKMTDEICYFIVELHVVPSKTQYKVSIVISQKDGSVIGINDCAKVHRLLLPYFEEVLHSEDVYMEVTSPGMERTLKNAAEFSLFQGRKVRVWDTEISDWISGTIALSDDTKVVLQLETTGEEKSFAYSTIAKAKLLLTEG